MEQNHKPGCVCWTNNRSWWGERHNAMVPLIVLLIRILCSIVDTSTKT